MPHHVVLVSLDALRADRLGCYGRTPSVTPVIDRLASEALLCSRALTPATWTVPAHISMLSGLDPLVHGCVSPLHRYPPEHLPFPLLFELLGGRGYAPLAITGGGFMEAQFGFGRAVPDFRVVGPVREALAAAVEHAACHERSFCFVHTYVVHDYPRVGSEPRRRQRADARDPAYGGVFPRDRDFHALLTALGTSADATRPGARDLAYLDELYLASVALADAALGELRGTLEAQDLWGETTLIVTSDHGESLGDEHDGRAFWSHGGPPYEEQARVPFIFRAAPALGSPLTPGAVAETVSLLDLTPTLLELCGASVERAALDGRSLLDLRRGLVAEFETRLLYSHSCEDSSDRYLDERLYGSGVDWRGDGKLIFDARRGALRELYWRDRDPRERENRVDELSQPDLKLIDEQIGAYFAGVAARARHPEALPIEDPAVLERLAQLGYVE
jgi:arylsulfatase A-like enzyme